jgi:hypothetical protein
MNHVMIDGSTIPISKMSNNHLNNTIKMIERRAEEGIEVMCGGGHEDGDIWYDTYMIYGAAALSRLGYRRYTRERDQRIKKDRLGWIVSTR